MRHERVLAPPAGAVLRPKRVEIDEAAEFVQPSAELVRLEAVYGATEVGKPSEERVVTPVPGPVRPGLELRQRAAPVRQVEGPRPLLREPRQEAEVRQGALPLLERPVRAVGSLVRPHDMDQRRAVVRPASVLEPELLAECAPTARAVKLELDLLPNLVRVQGVDRAPRRGRPTSVRVPGRKPWPCRRARPSAECSRNSGR